MKSNIKVAIIGGTGKSGKYLVAQLIKQGYSCKLLLRNPETFSIKNPLLEIIKGDVQNLDDIRALISDCDAVISALGMGKVLSSTSIFSQSTTHIIQAMTEFNLRRYIVLTGLNVDTEFDKKGAKTKFATEWMYTNYPLTTADRQTEYELLKASNLDWTLVRLPLIEQTEERYKVVVSLEDCLGDKISATDLADFLISQLSDNQYIKQSPFIFNG
jgi:putative NADH-flavin reductase